MLDHLIQNTQYASTLPSITTVLTLGLKLRRYYTMMYPSKIFILASVLGLAAALPAPQPTKYVHYNFVLSGYTKIANVVLLASAST